MKHLKFALFVIGKMMIYSFIIKFFFHNPNFPGGANQESLNAARKNYKKFGASAMQYINNVRAPLPNEIP